MPGHETRIIAGRDPNTGLPIAIQIPSGTIFSDWNPLFVEDETANDSDKVITVTADFQWHVLSIWVEYTSDATVGNRQLVVEIQEAAPSGDVKAQVRAGIVQAASLTRYYFFGPSMGDLLAFRDTDWLSTPIPPTWVLPPLTRIRVYDNNAISAAGDDMQVHILVAQRRV